jgi:acetyltransferase-like isoleucine patch superfamily enzyme
MVIMRVLMYALSAVSFFVDEVRKRKFHANLDPRVRIAKSAWVHPSVLMYPASGWIEIGENSTVNEFCTIHALGGGVKIGNGVRTGPHTAIVTQNHNFERLDIPIWKQGTRGKPIEIEDDVWIGAHCTILGGVKIGAHSVIGAHSLVTRDIPRYSVAYGIPCKVRRSRKDKEDKLSHRSHRK